MGTAKTLESLSAFGGDGSAALPGGDFAVLCGIAAVLLAAVTIGTAHVLVRRPVLRQKPPVRLCRVGRPGPPFPGQRFAGRRAGRTAHQGRRSPRGLPFLGTVRPFSSPVYPYDELWESTGGIFIRGYGMDCNILAIGDVEAFLSSTGSGSNWNITYAEGWDGLALQSIP